MVVGYYYYYYIIIIIIKITLCCVLFVYACFYLSSSRALFVIGLWAVKFAR
jgi:hypothetical protein